MLGLMIAVMFITGFNAYQLNNMIGMPMAPAAQTGQAGGQAQLAGPNVLPTGEPAVYGAELGVKYDDVSASNPQLADATIRKLAQHDMEIQLNPTQMERYVNILYKMENGMSCEYCCGARSIIFENGEPACGCAHSYAMRGVTKYLIVNHGDTFTDAQILEEAGKWKTLFFPTQLQQKAAILQSQGIELNYINLASNKYRGIEKQAGTGGSGGMVGGC